MLRQPWTFAYREWADAKLAFKYYARNGCKPLLVHSGIHDKYVLSVISPDCNFMPRAEDVVYEMSY